MKKHRISILLFILLVPMPFLAAEISKPVAFIDVEVISMESEEILSHRTVLVQNGKIVQIGEVKSFPLPNGTIQIKSRGKYRASKSIRHPTGPLIPIVLC